MLVTMLLSGCAHFRANQAQAHYDPTAGYRFAARERTADQDELFILLIFSGGGTRAAAMAYGVLDQLRHESLPDGRCLLDEVDVISAVSGGSFTAAYYGLFGKRIFSDFHRDFLDRSIQASLAWRAILLPASWWRLASGDYSRIDLAATYYDDHIFRHQTFADLRARPGAPYVVINATDMSLGAPFEFTQDQFDLIGSDLSSYPVAYAVAASSAFPVLLAPLTLANHREAPEYREPTWVAGAMEDATVDGARYRRATEVRSYLSTAGRDGAKARPYLHLIDGGVSDNLGIRTQWNRIATTDRLVGGGHGVPFHGLDVRAKLNSGAIKRLVLIIVNAKNAGEAGLDRSPNTPSVWRVLDDVTTVPMGNYSADSIDLVRREMDQWKKDEAKLDGPLHQVQYYVAEVAIGGIKDPGVREACNQVGTNFSLPRKQVDLMHDVAGQVLAKSPDYQRLLHDIGATGGR